LIGARQGQADLVHAIDVMRLKPAIDETLASWEFRESLPTAAGSGDFSSFKAIYANLKKNSNAISKTKQELLSWRKRTVVWLGVDSDKEAVIQSIKGAVESAKAAGLAVGMETRKLLQLLEEFRGARVIAALDDVEKLGGELSKGQILTVLGHGHMEVVQLCDDVRSQVDDFLEPVEARLESDSTQLGDDPVGDALSDLQSEVSELIAILESAGKL
jgi:hypothetical protein